MKTELRDFDVSVPTKDGRGIAELITIQISMEWDDELGEWLMTEEGLKQIDLTKKRSLHEMS